MHTRCPHCGTCFRVTPEQLELAQGAVRCGRCLNTFNAREFLFDSPGEETNQAPAETQETIPTESSDDRPATTPSTLTEADSCDNAAKADQTKQADEAKTKEPTPAGEEADIAPQKEEITPVSERSLDVLEEIESRSAIEKRRGLIRTLAALSTIALLTLTLIGQYLYANRAAMAQDLDTRPWIEALCAVTGCEVPLLHKPQYIKLVDRDIRSHPKHKEALLVEAEMVNEAPFVQAYPILKLTLHDITGKVLSGRSFTPEEYLPRNIDPKTGMAPGKHLKVILVLKDPGDEAVGFEFEFH